MKQKPQQALSAVMALTLCAIGSVALTGCGSKSASDQQSHQTIKAAMGGNYSAAAAAQGRAYQQQEQAKQLQMQQTHSQGGSGTP